MGHTKGPWILLSSGIMVNLPYRAALSNTALSNWCSDENFVAEIAYKNKANVTLIEAAPDLLEASEEMLEILNVLDGQGAILEEDGCKWSKWEKAISKAKGGE